MGGILIPMPSIGMKMVDIGRIPHGPLVRSVVTPIAAEWPGRESEPPTVPNQMSRQSLSQAESREDTTFSPALLLCQSCHAMIFVVSEGGQYNDGSVCEAYLKAEMAYYLEKRPESGFIWRPYKQKSGGESRQTMRCPVARVNE